jgi:pyrroline-5-carboxylate reductase
VASSTGNNGKPMRAGIIGVGHLAGALVEGLCASPALCDSLRLSPRSLERARALASRFDEVSVAADNQEVLDAADVVMVAVLPGQAEAVLAPLAFRENHVVVSLVATLPLARIAPLVAPATTLQRAVPLTTVARRHGPLAVWPDLAGTRRMWSTLGERVACASEHELETLWSVTALVSPFYTLLDAVHGWCLRNEAGADNAARYVPALFEALARQTREPRAVTDFAALSAAAQTRGGLNEQAVAIVRARGADAALVEALDVIRRRLAAAAAGPDS